MNDKAIKGIRRGICTGSFDPVTTGHVDIFKRAAGLFDELIVGVFTNIRKKSFFTVEERKILIEDAVKDIPNIRVIAFSGLLAEYMQSNDIRTVVRGIRSVADYEYEQVQAMYLKQLNPSLETIFLLSKPELAHISSSGVKEVARFRGNIEGMVPSNVAEAVLAKGLNK